MYSHRNDEAETPTVSGRYWLEGYMPKATGVHAWGYSFGAKGHDDMPYFIDVEAQTIDMDGTGYHEPLATFEGRFWGPVDMPVPPWDKPTDSPPPATVQGGVPSEVASTLKATVVYAQQMAVINRTMDDAVRTRFNKAIAWLDALAQEAS